MDYTRATNTRRLALALLTVSFLVALWLARDSFSSHDFDAKGMTMGTYWSVTIDRRALSQRLTEDLDRIPELAQDYFDEIEQIFSTWSPDSEIAHINRGQNDRPLSKTMHAVLDQARALAHHNEEFLDFHLQPVLQRYGFEWSREQLSESPVADADAVGLNLSAIVKGYAVEQLSRRLAELGYADTLVELGGEIAARCSARTRPWRIAVAHPHRPATAAPAEIIELCNQSVATSGDYHNTVYIDGKTHSHLIDPVTGQPKMNSTRSVTVVSDRASVADAYATAFAVSGLKNSARVYIHAPVRVLFLSDSGTGELVSIWKDFMPPQDD
ncbi:MAG: FAD:protein FMN transferase [Gammaproteobacteria bacterium]|nr:FAD:protein FMN transferase [Gammaproteobacteria bacterium]